MSRKNPNATCAECGEPRGRGRVKYCGDACYQKARARLARAKRDKQQAACKRCGGPKEPGIRGSKMCAKCRELAAEAHQMYERERARRRAAKMREERGATHRPETYVGDQKWCARCEEYRDLDLFGRRSPRPGNLRVAYCRPCQKAYNAERRLKITYGIDWDEYDLMLSVQEGRCAICGGRPRKYLLAVDHDHKTGEIRGLLCSRCNHKLLGSANDDPARLRKAADYLESYLARDVFGEPRYVPGSDGAA